MFSEVTASAITLSETVHAGAERGEQAVLALVPPREGALGPEGEVHGPAAQADAVPPGHAAARTRRTIHLSNLIRTAEEPRSVLPTFQRC